MKIILEENDVIQTKIEGGYRIIFKSPININAGDKVDIQYPIVLDNEPKPKYHIDLRD